LAVNGFQQKEGIDYTDIFSPVMKMTTIRIVISIAAVDDLHLEQLDVKLCSFMVSWRKIFTSSNHSDSQHKGMRV
jgi:hypothetical protein